MYLAIIYCEIKMVQRMMCWAVDDMLERMTSDHVRVVYLCENNQIGEQKTVSNRNRKLHTRIVQKLTKTKSPKYNIRCNGKMKMKR